MDFIIINIQPYLLTKPAKINLYSIQACTAWGIVEKREVYIY